MSMLFNRLQQTPGSVSKKESEVATPIQEFKSKTSYFIFPTTQQPPSITSPLQLRTPPAPRRTRNSIHTQLTYDSRQGINLNLLPAHVCVCGAVRISYCSQSDSQSVSV
ncbi:hypothetical protein ACMFMG_008965 [Clarireedia jacksonii]